jgi:hypothetical protein
MSAGAIRRGVAALGARVFGDGPRSTTQGCARSSTAPEGEAALRAPAATAALSPFAAALLLGCGATTGWGS